MPASVQIGLAFALATALASVVGFLYKQRGAVESPPVRWSSPIRSSLLLFRSRWYVLGMAIAMGSWGLHVAALALAPISLVQSVIAGGLVLLTVAADRLFGFEVTRREWIGVVLSAAGLAFLAATIEGAAEQRHSDYETLVLLTYIFLFTLASFALAAAASGRRREGVALGVSAGLLWGASDVAIKALSDSLGDDGILVLAHPLALFILAASLLGLTVSARSLQLGDAVAVIAVTSVTANLVTIASGTVVFSEPLPEEALGQAARVIAFLLVIAAAAFTPAPVRAAGVELEPASRQA